MKHMKRMKERGKWLVALALCLSCLMLCATLISAPTLAEPEPPAPHRAVTGFRNVYERLNEGASKSPKEYFYASSAKPGDVCNLEVRAREDKFVIPLRDGESVREILIKANGTLDTANPAPPEEASAALKALAPARVNIYELCDKDGNSLSPVKYAYASGAEAKGELPLAVYKLGEKFYVHHGYGKYLGEDKAAYDGYVAVAADGTLDCNDVILTGVGKRPGSADDVTMYPKAPPPAGPGKYKAVDGYQKLYEALDGNGNPKEPREYLLSDTAPTDGSAPPAKSQKVYTKNGFYYAEIVAGSNIFLAIKNDGSADLSNVIWSPSGKFGSSDDFATSVKEENGYFLWKQADGLWKIIEGILNPEKTTTAPETSSTAPEDTTDVDGSATTEDDWLNGSNPNLVKTGKEDSFNTGVAVCMALLFMGCAYCGWQAFRRRARYH